MINVQLEAALDPKMDTLYITINDKALAHTEILDANRFIDYDKHMHPIGVEFLHVSRGVRIGHLPYAEALGAELRRLNIVLAD
jgi:uncharacterized protein YuzE